MNTESKSPGSPYTKKHRIATILALGVTFSLTTLSLTACGSGGAGNDGKPSVIVGFYPQEFLAKSIGGDAVTVTSLAQPGAEPHDMEITGQQLGKVAEAKLVIYEKGIMPALDDAVANNAKNHSLDLASVTDLKQLHSDAGGEGEEGKDLHIWLDPMLMKKMAEAVGKKLTEIDEPNASTYDENTTKLAASLDTLDAEFKSGLADCERTSIVTTHEAFGYLADRYGLEQVGIAGLSPDVEPSPQRLAEVKQYAQEHGATTIFFEESVSPKYAETIASAVGAKTAVLSPIEVARGGKDYIGIMQDNLAALKKALGCS